MKIILSVMLLLSLSFVTHAQEQITPEVAKTSNPTSTDSNIGLFLEPALTFEIGRMNLTYLPPYSNSRDETYGVGLGGRLGFHAYDTFFLALDGRYSRLNYDSSTLAGEGSANSYNLGLTLGGQTPLAGLRLWATYLFTGILNPSTIKEVDLKFKGLNGVRLGGGFYVAMFSVNLEYQYAKYSSTVIENSGAILPGQQNTMKGTQHSYILSASFPISL